MNEKELLESVRAMVNAKEESIRNLKEIVIAREAEIDSLNIELKNCICELCLHCGKYREEYLGACDGCRWKATKERLYGKA